MLVTAPADANLMPSMVAQFSNSVFSCFTFGPMLGAYDPDAKKQAIEGMIPDKIAARGFRLVAAASG
jgi:hypothetical protein